MSRPRLLALAAVVAGCAVVGLSVVFESLGLKSVGALGGAYGGHAILAFELARTPADLATVIGADPPDADALAVRAAMDRANRIDFAYMAIYGAFIALSCALAAGVRGRRWLLAGVALGPLAAMFDLLENLALLDLTRPHADVAPLLDALHWRTTAKWELLAATSALFALGFAGDARRPVKGAALAVALLAVAGGVLLLVDPRAWAVLLLNAIVIAWLWQLGYALVRLRAP